MKKYYCSGCDAISVYQFMSMCGLEVEYRGNILLSHDAMMKKLILRSGKVTIPSRVSLDAIEKSAVSTGKIILVRDDYSKILGYKRPIDCTSVWHDRKTEEEREQIRKKLIEEYENSQLDEKELKPGYQKYLQKKEKKKKN